MAATLKDVAALAGVSVKTVSNVVNGYAFVKPENRRRVEDALAATGYRPNLGARNLRRGRTGFIALVVPELSIPYFGELAGLVITAARRHHWNVLIEQTQGARDRERSALAAMGPHMIDGAILSPQALAAEDFGAFDLAVPLVLVGEHSVEVPFDRVAIDNVQAAQRAVAHLAALGRRRIAAIGQHPWRGTAALRMEGYRAALHSAGLPETGELIVPALEYHRREGAQAMRRLLELPHPPDAVFCFNDLLAIGALRTAAEHGLRVPDDVAIIGFDNTEESAYSIPSLTTIAPDKAAIATTAVDLIRRRVDARDAFAVQDVQIPYSLEIRESTVGRAAQ
ncbi:LacI family DNA-binding transcriptional regulator [Actinomadura opuntiae]|uniref:LacI family DNA-binding transcriptional regulator n=1 Tax=Actinomadura sp. OS1-43 TaxID=604315 RepID=UPI00255AEF6B|nr:LacI family DNA-binding transcriptional regulator [Actinomadura sp. OS1-43]MDL4818466.1 LacI family DNA-binding transcriptional regulator [Actinomadura sp. OS1-43]